MTRPSIEEIWFWKYFGPASGDVLHGRCAACEYEGPTHDFRVWRRGIRVKVLCSQCSSDVFTTMVFEKWVREDRGGARDLVP